MTDQSSVARRNFIRKSGLMIAGGAISGAMVAGKAVAGRSRRPIRVGVVGCGRRARALLDSVLSIDESVRVVALADVLPSQVQATYRTVKGRHAEQLDANCLRCSGWDAYESVMQTDADLVYLTAPPVFRPQHFEAAIDSGKHVFLEKPLAADVGQTVRMMGLAQRAFANGQSAFVGFQKRFDPCYDETIQRIQSGAIGRLIWARTYCNAGPLKSPRVANKESQREFEVRNWNHFHWTGGELHLEQHVAGLDRIRAATSELPVAASAQGGWGMPPESAGVTDSERVFDHLTVEYEFGTGLRLMSQCRRGGSQPGKQVGEHLHGSEGRADLAAGRLYDAEDRLIWKSPTRASSQTATALQQRFIVESIRSEEVINEVDDAAESTLFALLGQLASKSRKRETWNDMLRSAAT
ncbi:MAG: Gfo/Idh/MocA family oxidoreductase [Planctomycetota bacterium]